MTNFLLKKALNTYLLRLSNEVPKTLVTLEYNDNDFSPSDECSATIITAQSLLRTRALLTRPPCLMLRISFQFLQLEVALSIRIPVSSFCKNVRKVSFWNVEASILKGHILLAIRDGDRNCKDTRKDEK